MISDGNRGSGGLRKVVTAFGILGTAPNCAPTIPVCREAGPPIPLHAPAMGAVSSG